MTSSISVLPGVGTAPVEVAVGLGPGGAAAPSHATASADGLTTTPVTDASVQAFAAAAATLSSVIMPKLSLPQLGPFIFGYPS